MVLIKHPKGIAKKSNQPHVFEIKNKKILIKSKKIQEVENATTENIKRGEGPQNIELTKNSTSFMVIDMITGEILLAETVEGNKSDEDCLALMGYYLADYDELKEAEKIKRLVDIGKYLE